MIPPFHDVYGTGEGAAISLNFMSYQYPDSGWHGKVFESASASMNVLIGCQGIDTPLTNYEYFVRTFNETPERLTNYGGSKVTWDYHGLEAPHEKLPNYYYWWECIEDPMCYYDNDPSSYACYPSPYLADGSRNPSYYVSKINDCINAFSDFDGVGNSQTFLSYATGQSNWKTASTINNTNSSNHCPLFCCAWRYHTVGTNQGDWYIPSIGEAGYFPCRRETILNSIVNIVCADGIVPSDDVKMNPDLISSTEYYYNNTAYTFAYDNQGFIRPVTRYGTSTSIHTRAFLRF